MPNQTAKREALIARHAEARIRSAMVDTRIVAIIGPRQSGKTTLARRIADSDGRQFVTLDDEQSRRFAQDDPTGFTRGLNQAVIDEIQRVPDLILALNMQCPSRCSGSPERSEAPLAESEVPIANYGWLIVRIVAQ